MYASGGGVKLALMFGIWIGLFLAFTYAGVDYRLFFYWPFYAIGVLCSGKEVTSEKWHYSIMLMSAIVFIFVSKNLGNGIEILSFISAGCFIFFILNFGRILEKTALLKVLSLISYASMCAYLFHRPFYYYIMKVAGHFSILVAYLFILPILLALCYGIQQLYDKLVKNRIYNKIGHVYKVKNKND